MIHDQGNHFKIIFQEESPIRIDKFLSTEFREYSREHIKRLISQKCVLVNGKAVSANKHLLKYNDKIAIIFPEPKKQKCNLMGSDFPFSIIFEDEDILVIDKNHGLTVHPGAGTIGNTLVDVLIEEYKVNLSNVEGFYPGIVHRLDKDTSGLMVIAKNDIAHHSLASQIANKEMIRSYNALIFGVLSPQDGSINNNIARSKNDRTKMCITVVGGKKAVTHYKTLKKFDHNALSLLCCTLETGRTHQIRLHMCYAKHHIVGDKKYLNGYNHPLTGIQEEIKKMIRSFPRQALHATSLSLTHPLKKYPLSFNIKLPEDIRNLIDAIAKNVPNI